MSLTRAKQHLEIIAASHVEKRNFELFDSQRKSYYLEYDNAVHEENVLMKFDSSNISEIRKHLEVLWKDKAEEKEIKKVISIILAGIIESNGICNERIPDIDLYNYML